LNGTHAFLVEQSHRDPTKKYVRKPSALKQSAVFQSSASKKIEVRRSTSRRSRRKNQTRSKSKRMPRSKKNKQTEKVDEKSQQLSFKTKV